MIQDEVKPRNRYLFVIGNKVIVHCKETVDLYHYIRKKERSMWKILRTSLIFKKILSNWLLKIV